MLKLYVLCGSAGSGKTTFSKKMAEEQQLVRYSYDEMNCITHIDLNEPIISSLQKGESVVVDSLYVRGRQRKALLSAVKDIECEKILVFMNTSLNECLRRNAQRERTLPPKVVKTIFNSIERPSLDEGWDEIIEYTS